MRLLYYTSIKRKQMLIIMLTSTVALLLACAIFVGDDVISFRKGIVAKCFGAGGSHRQQLFGHH